MAKKTLTQMTASLKLRLGGLLATDPIWVDSNSGVEFVNKAQDFVVLRTLRGDRRRLNLFTELRDRWHVPTIEQAAFLDLPEKCLTIDKAYSYDLPGLGAEPDESLAKKRRMRLVSEDEYETYPRSATPTGWPRYMTRMGDRIYVAPTPGVGWSSWLLVKGLKSCNDLVNPTDVSGLKEIWEHAIEEAAAYLAFERLGWYEDAQVALSGLDTAITNTVDIMGMERSQRDTRGRMRGMPRG